jgi:hypothetical protein
MVSDFAVWRKGEVANVWNSYEHHSIHEPAILLGGAFVVDVVEKEQEEKTK